MNINTDPKNIGNALNLQINSPKFTDDNNQLTENKAHSNYNIKSEDFKNKKVKKI